MNLLKENYIGALADLGLFTCALLWGLSFPAMKILVAIYPVNWLLCLRFLFGGAITFIFFYKRILNMSGAELKGGIIIGLFLFAALTMQTIGLLYMSGGRNAFITAIYVVLVPLILWMFKKIFPGWLVLIAACICLTGMALLAGDISEPFNIGDLFTILSAFLFAGQILAIAKYTQGSDPIAISFIQFAVLAICSLAAGLIFEPAFALNLINNYKFYLSSSGGFYQLVFMIFVCSFICYTLQVCSQKYANPTHAVIIMSLEAVFGLISGIIFIGETVTLQAAIGCALIFIAVLMVELRHFVKI
ncbi:MAG: DMT family transporter [Synergistaceae bacterium]|nr:DMT family transporter [Synergistaceae bacterium]